MDENGKYYVKIIIPTEILHIALQMRANTLRVLCNVTEHAIYCKVIFVMSICLCVQT